MFRILVLACAFTACVANAEGGAQKVTPVEKVIELLKKLSAQTAEEGKTEAKQYDDFSCFCKEQADEKLYNIEKGTAKLEKLAAKIAETESLIATLNGDISDLSKQMTSLDEDIKEATELRAKEHAAYLVEATDISGAIEAMEGALKALADAKEGQEGDSKALLLLQSMAVSVLKVGNTNKDFMPTPKEQSLLSMLRAETESAAPGEAHGYEMKSNTIIQTLKDMKKTFKENKVDLDNAEFAAKSAFEKKKLGLQNEHQFAGEDKDEKSALVESKSEELAADKESEAEETKAKAAENAFMKELTDQCEKKAKQFDQRSKARTDELTALSSALDALESGVKPNYDANSKLTGLLQTGKKAITSLLQLSETTGEVSERVLRLIESAATNLNSPELVSLSMKVRLSKDHFVKVRQMIKDLIAKLKADAKAEAEQKGFCDKEMAKAIGNRDEANMIIEEKTATTSKLSAEKAELTTDNEELSAAIAENMKALKEATELRNKEKAANEKTLADSEAGKEAVTFALTTLKDFYGGAAFLQKSVYTPPNAGADGKTVGDMAPSTAEGDYKGNQEASKGIIGLLDVILSDFERTIETTTEEETTAQGEFDTFESDTNSDTEAKEDEITTKENRISEINDELMSTENDHNDAKTQLADAKASLEKLKPMCVEQGPTYEEKVAKREQEIAALKEAMQILIDWQGL
eukprot:gnl/TRDRNA2_/TRDRNA2_176407_c1_seq16.p1 gnl/TRDRNA2_/TRDRNA2_176407_c1~~gnl/TRDRNA2_/TRDRNA2_176407_c1_seq16.p1  ORF type:complete len:695 (+),score=277.90 gnl/TRDRNA2_/TRDRNA2_176407_c1_seq16:88-2172(+)